MNICLRLATIGLLTSSVLASPAAGQPPINPFGPRQQDRADALPGFAQLSDGTVLAGQLYLTRDTRLKVFDVTAQRQREVPLQAVQQLVCEVKRQWMEREWRFKENANNEKVYTGRSYPAREYVHTLMLANGKQIKGDLSGILYVRIKNKPSAVRLLMHKRQKGPAGTDLKSLNYLQRVELGEQALAKGLQLQAEQDVQRGRGDRR